MWSQYVHDVAVHAADEALIVLHETDEAGNIVFTKRHGIDACTKTKPPNNNRK